MGWEQVMTKRVWLHCHSAPKTGLVTARGRTASTPPATVKTTATTPRMNFIVHSSGFNVQSPYMRSLDHCPKLWPLHDPSLRRDHVVTDRPMLRSRKGEDSPAAVRDPVNVLRGLISTKQIGSLDNTIFFGPRSQPKAYGAIANAVCLWRKPCDGPRTTRSRSGICHAPC